MDPTKRRDWTSVAVGSSQSEWRSSANAPFNAFTPGYGYIEYCGEETFQYDRTHDNGLAAEFRMNIRCDVTRNREQKQLGHKFSAVVEVQNAMPHKQVLLAWARNSGTAEWAPSPKCSYQSALRSIDEDAGQVARGRADADGYVKFRQYLEKCDTYVYQAISSPQASDCKLSKMVYGQANRGAGGEKGGRGKFSLRPYDKVNAGSDSPWPLSSSQDGWAFPAVDARVNPGEGIGDASGSTSQDLSAPVDGMAQELVELLAGGQLA